MYMFAVLYSTFAIVLLLRLFGKYPTILTSQERYIQTSTLKSQILGSLSTDLLSAKCILIAWYKTVL